VWFVTVGVKRYVSLASILAAISVPITSALLGKPVQFVLFAITICMITCYKHKSNIVRLINGEEPRIGGDLEIKR
jgi:glycerol-3-phosphate acyltransferase PlsY